MDVRRLAEVDDKVYEAVCCEIVCEEVHEAKVQRRAGVCSSIRKAGRLALHWRTGHLQIRNVNEPTS